MNFSTRKCVHTQLNKYCSLAKPHEIIEVTEWTNGEGWDVAVGTRNFQLSYGEFAALQVLTNIVFPRE